MPVPALLNDPVLGLGLLAFALLLLVLPLSFWSLSGGRNSTAVRLLVAAANLCLTAQLVLRWLDSGHFPISNLYESLCFLAWGCTLTQLLVQPFALIAIAILYADRVLRVDGRLPG